MIFTHYQQALLNMPGDSPKTYIYMCLSTDSFSLLPARKNSADAKDMEEIVRIFKQVPPSRRDFNPATFVWTFEGTAILQLLKLYYHGKIPNLKPAALNQFLIEHPDLDVFLNPPKVDSYGYGDDWKKIRAKLESKVDHDDFFHQPVTTDTRTPASIDQQLRALIGVNDTKCELTRKMYLQAVKRYHPDFGGDAKKMSELNELWTIYNNK